MGETDVGVVVSVLIKQEGGEHRLCGHLLKLSDLGMARMILTNQDYYKVWRAVVAAGMLAHSCWLL